MIIRTPAAILDGMQLGFEPMTIEELAALTPDERLTRRAKIEAISEMLASVARPDADALGWEIAAELVKLYSDRWPENT